MSAALAILFALQAAAPPDTVHLVVVATTDVHGRALAWDYVRDAEFPGGLTRAATLIETLRAQNPDRVILLDAGDLLQGNQFAAYFATVEPRRPNPVVDALNALGYDAATPGNHDFNFGIDHLRRAAEDATYRYVAANVMAGAQTLFPSYTIVTRGSARVGVVGFTTPGVNVWDRATLRGTGVRVVPIIETAPDAVRRARAAGADLVVAVIHSGLGGGSSYDTTGVGPENVAGALAFITPKPDVVIVGHSHREMRDSLINGVHFVQPRNWAQSLSVVHVWLARTSPTARYRVTEVRAEILPLAGVPESPRVVRRLAPAHETVRAWAGQPIAEAGPGFSGRYARAEDTPLLDYVNEVQRSRAGADLAATASFDREAGLPAGGIRLRDVTGVYPYENTLRAVRISGAQLKAFLEHSSRYYRGWDGAAPLIDPDVPGYDFDVVSGATYTLDLRRPVGQRVQNLAVRARPVASTDSFTLALNSYRQEGGGGYAMLRGARVVYDRGENVRDLLVEDLRARRTLDTAGVFTRSWSIIPPEAAAEARRLAAPPVTPVRQADTTLLRVLVTTDFHGALVPRTWSWSGGRLVGGAAALKSWLDSLDRDCGCSVVRLDAGDQMQGTPLSNFTGGRATIEAFNQLGLDAAAIGNHEFDWSVDSLRARMAEARYQFVAANITDSAGARPDWAEPFTVISRGAVRVAVIGVITTSTPTATRPSNVRHLRFPDPAPMVREVLPQARRAADFVIVVAHEGAVCDSTGCRGPILDFARALDSGSVDLIVAGHSHRRVTTRVNGIPILEAASNGTNIGVADFVRVGGRREVRTRLIDAYVDQVRPDTGLAHFVGDLERRYEGEINKVVATLRVPMSNRGAQHPLGNLIADAQRAAAKADVAIMNNGGVRAELVAGPVTWGQLYTVQPFGNRILRIRLTGRELMAALEHIVSGQSPHAHVSGVEVWYDQSRRPGNRIVRARLPSGRGISRGRTYTLAVSDFLADGGDGFTMLRGKPTEDADADDIGALVRYLTVLRQPVDAPDAPRLHTGGRF